MPVPHRAGPSPVRCAYCETLSPERFQLLFSLWGWDQPSPSVPYTPHREAPRWGAGITATPAKRVALATRVAPLPGLSRSVGNKNLSENTQTEEHRREVKPDTEARGKANIYEAEMASLNQRRESRRRSEIFLLFISNFLGWISSKEHSIHEENVSGKHWCRLSVGFACRLHRADACCLQRMSKPPSTGSRVPCLDISSLILTQISSTYTYQMTFQSTCSRCSVLYKENQVDGAGRGGSHNPSTLEGRGGQITSGQEFETSLANTVELCLY
ncbi:hypothetical protein AAY473_009279 [Plecturocebus cupreus]